MLPPLSSFPLWFTPDPTFQSLLEQTPSQVVSKKSGAKNAGRWTGVYTFEKEKILIKQGDEIGETIAEYIGGHLYQLTMPHLTAPCILIRDKAQADLTASLYVGSVYAQGNVQDAYQVAGYDSRPRFAGVKARLASLFNYESLLRKLIKIDNEEANHSMAISAANSLWHGDPDFHAGNLILVEKEGKKTFMRIDYGFSFFDFGKNIINIFNPFAGKSVSFDLKRFLQGGKLIAFHPTNHFWDLAAESKSFYFHPSFIKAGEDIISLSPEKIRRNIRESIEKIKWTCGEQAEEALSALAKRIDLPPDEDIEDYMVDTLIARQKSMQALIDYCREKNTLLNEKKERRALSYFLNEKIIAYLDNSNETLSLKLLKLLQQANDLGQLEIVEGQLRITDTFYFHYGKTTPMRVSPNNFAALMQQEEIRQAPLLKEVIDFLTPRPSLSPPKRRRLG